MTDPLEPSAQEPAPAPSLPQEPEASRPLAEPVAWRHNLTHTLHDTEEEVQLADAESWAEPLYLHPQVTEAPSLGAGTEAAERPAEPIGYVHNSAGGPDRYIAVHAAKTVNFGVPVYLRASLPEATAQPAELEYPSSSEGTVRCTCQEFPHADGCGSMIGQRGWEAGYQRAIDDAGWTRDEAGLASLPEATAQSPALSMSMFASREDYEKALLATPEARTLPEPTEVLRAALTYCDVPLAYAGAIMDAFKRRLAVVSPAACNHWPGQRACQWCDLGKQP